MADHADLIGTAVKNKLSTQLAGWTIKRRKTLSLTSKDRTSLPIAVIVVGEEGDVQRQWWPVDEASFPVTVALYFATDGEKLADDATIRETRANVRNAINAPSTYELAVPGFQEVQAAGRTVFGAAALSANQNQTTLSCKVSVYIDRST